MLYYYCLRMSRGDTTGASRCLCFDPPFPPLSVCHGVSLPSWQCFISHLLIVAHVSDAWIRAAPYRPRPASCTTALSVPACISPTTHYTNSTPPPTTLLLRSPSNKPHPVDARVISGYYSFRYLSHPSTRSWPRHWFVPLVQLRAGGS
jgi:hypothetical protein